MLEIIPANSFSGTYHSASAKSFLQKPPWSGRQKPMTMSGTSAGRGVKIVAPLEWWEMLPAKEVEWKFEFFKTLFSYAGGLSSMHEHDKPLDENSVKSRLKWSLEHNGCGR